METTKIYSIAGQLPKGRGLISARPFRSPHHSASAAALAGGGTTFRPGECSLADCGVLFLDELVYTIGSKLFDEQLLLDFLDHKPEKLEVILTGQGPSEALIERADYVSELKKIKHPFDKGLAARDGIER